VKNVIIKCVQELGYKSDTIQNIEQFTFICVSV